MGATISIQAFVGDESGDSERIKFTYGFKSYGNGRCGDTVYAAKMCKTNEKIAIKPLQTTEPYEHAEIAYLKELKHCNIVDMMYYFRDEDFPRYYIVTKRMPNTLYDLYSRRIQISEFDTKLYMYQLLRALAYLHNKDICHRDVKPESILVDIRTGVLKLHDFGNATDLTLSDGNDPRVGSLFYRAPEMLLNYVKYTKIVDMWSAGCILVELLRGGKELFNTAANEHTQLRKMIEYFGTPTPYQFMDMVPALLFDGLPKMKAKSWVDILSPNSATMDSVSLCTNLLCYSPSCRLLPQEALAHKFFDVLRSPETTRLANGNPLPPLFNFQPGEFPGDFELLVPSYMRSGNDEVTGGSVATVTTNADEKPCTSGCDSL